MDLCSISRTEDCKAPCVHPECVWSAHGDVTVPCAPPPRFLWEPRQSHRPQGDGFQIHKIHRIFHKWMNTISSQFPHYANMQNIKSRPIRDSHSFKFTGLSRNCRNPQIITQLIGNICDRYNKFSSQITFHPRDHRAPVKSYRGLISLT